MTYPLRNIPDVIDRAIRALAAAEYKTSEQTVVDAFARDFDVAHFSIPSDSSDIEGDVIEEAEFKAARREHRILDWENGGDGVKSPNLSGIADQRLVTLEIKAAFSEQRRVRPKPRK